MPLSVRPVALFLSTPLSSVEGCASRRQIGNTPMSRFFIDARLSAVDSTVTLVWYPRERGDSTVRLLWYRGGAAGQRCQHGKRRLTPRTGPEDAVEYPINHQTFCAP